MIRVVEIVDVVASDAGGLPGAGRLMAGVLGLPVAASAEGRQLNGGLSPDVESEGQTPLGGVGPESNVALAMPRKVVAPFAATIDRRPEVPTCARVVDDRAALAPGRFVASGAGHARIDGRGVVA